MSILIVTRSDDNESVKMVTAALEAKGAEVIRLDSDLYPTELRLSTGFDGARWSKRLHTPAGSYDLGAVTALWYRRFFAGGRLPKELGDTREACANEARRTLYGTIAGLGCFELDPLIAVRKGDHKELLLRRARELGLEVAPTLFSNDPAEVRAFFEAVGGQMITKMQSSFAIYRDGEENVVFTTVVKPEDLEDLEGLRYSPMTFQALIPKTVEIRSTVVGRRVYSASIDSQQSEAAKIDWRRDGIGLLRKWVPYQLPAEVEAGLLALTRDFGLNYAAADFIVTPDGRHVFLEINAGGEWFWLQQAPGLPIAAALAEVLLGEAERI